MSLQARELLSKLKIHYGAPGYAPLDEQAMRWIEKAIETARQDEYNLGCYDTKQDYKENL